MRGRRPRCCFGRAKLALRTYRREAGRVRCTIATRIPDLHGLSRPLSMAARGQYGQATRPVEARLSGSSGCLARRGFRTPRELLVGQDRRSPPFLMKRAPIKRVHVNQHVIRANQRSGERLSPLRVKTGRENAPAQEILIDGPCRVIYRPDRPLSCGARVWIETTSRVAILDGGSEVKSFD